MEFNHDNNNILQNNSKDMMNVLKTWMSQSENNFKKQLSFFLGICFLLIATGNLNAQCPDYGARKKVASSFHSTEIIDSAGVVRYWGDAIDASGSGANVLTPLTLTGYTGIPVALAAGSTSATTHQHYLLTTTNLYGWGYSANTIINATLGNVALTNIAFPAGVTAATTSFIEGANGGIALVTATGEVWIKAGAGSACAPSAYGDGSAALNTAWHHVTTSAAGNPFLTGVDRLSFSGNAVIASTTTGAVYVWGVNTYLGNGTAVATRNRATLVTNPAGVTPADVNIIADGALNSSQFILGTNGNLYAVGENNAGQLGQNNTTTLTTWTAVKDAAGTGILSNIIQLTSNNPYNFSRYSVGVLRSDNIVFLWGFNDQNMAGSAGGNVLLPRIPDNYSISGAKVSYIKMGGHTTLTFLLGTNKFCYIGHKIRGSMGDGTNGTSAVPSFDCYNTPGEYLCPGPLKFCVTPSSNDLVACANHATTLINDFPSFTYWGEATSSYLTPGLNELDPQNLFEYNGTPRGVAAGSVGAVLEAANTQMWALTDEGLWGWGYSANTIVNATLGNVVNTSVALPGGVTAAQVSFIRASRGGVALVTTTGEVWVKAGAGSNCSFNVYGDGSGALNTAWHQVTTSAAGNPVLTGVTDLSFGGTVALAVTPAGTYVWGDNTFLGNGTAAATRNRATLIPAISGVTANKVEIIQAGALNAAQFILGNNGKVYAVGENKDGVLGQNNTTSLTTWTTVKNATNTGDLVSVSKLSTNNPFAFDSYSVGALTIGGTLYLWGDNNTSRLGGVAARYTLPRIPPTLAAGTISNFDIGGHFSIAFRKGSSIFCFIGHQVNGSLGDNTTNTSTVSTSDCASTPVIAQCAGTAFDISGNVYNDNNMLSDDLVNGSLTSSAGASPLYAILLDNNGFVLESIAISGGIYNFVGYPAGSYSVAISTTAGTVGNTAPALGLPAGWIPAGEQLGVVPSVGIDLPVDGIIALTISTGNITDVNFGIVYPKPVAVNDTISTPEDTPVTFSLSANDTDVDSNLVVSSVTLLGTPPLSQGTVTNNGDGTITFNPAPDFNGVVTPFDYQICDASGLCDTATVYITVTPVNDLPTAEADNASVPEEIGRAHV